MLVSCKISNSVINYLERQREDLSFVYDGTDLPDEFLRDPSYWMDAGTMETFLFRAAQSSRQFDRKEEFFEAVGHACPKLAAWGVLDHVLKMMPRPQDILKQPGRLLSYFFSPEPPVALLTTHEDQVEFDLPISSDQYPAITCYMKAAFEALPVYVGQPMAEARWDGIHFQLKWFEQQNSLFEVEDPGHNISPELMGNIINSLEQGQKQLEEKNKELLEKNAELEQAYRESQRRYVLELEKQRHNQQGGALSSLSYESAPELKESLRTISKELLRLSDYMVRAQQLITLLVGSGRMTPEVREAMRRVDWEYVKQEFPLSLQQTSEEIRRLRSLESRQNSKNPQQDLG